jgi:integrase
MFFQEYDNQDGYQVWLDQGEVETLLAATDDSQHRLALELGARCGLRSDEIVRVAPADVRRTEAGPMLRVDSAKGGGLRQTPLPEQLATRLETIADVRAEPDATEAALNVTTRTLRRWIDRYGERLADSEGEPMWTELGMHDLRRTWATQLKGDDVDAMVVCDWGGWSDLETFLQHYRGKFSPEQQRKQREKVAWL